MTPRAGGHGVQRFRARIRKEGVNPFVDVPAHVSVAFSARAKAGRVRVEGRLNGVAIRGALVPTQHGQRLYVNGGMRAVAGVEVGDTITLALRALPPEAVAVPGDLRQRLTRAGASAAFDRLPASQRRELVRFVDDSRTRPARAVRIQQTVDHVRSGGTAPPAPRPGRVAARPLWTCPRCGNAFVTRNAQHSCGRHSLEALFAGKPPLVRDLFERFRALVESCGAVKSVVYRDRVGFMVRVRFAGATPRARALDVGFWLRRRVDSPRLRRVETLAPHVHIHTLRVEAPEQLDTELLGWMREAYAVGCQSGVNG